MLQSWGGGHVPASLPPQSHLPGSAQATREGAGLCVRQWQGQGNAGGGAAIPLQAHLEIVATMCLPAIPTRWAPRAPGGAGRPGGQVGPGAPAPARCRRDPRPSPAKRRVSGQGSTDRTSARGEGGRLPGAADHPDRTGQHPRPPGGGPKAPVNLGNNPFPPERARLTEPR